MGRLNELKGKSLLVLINITCALSIFFFGYDQGMMGGVNSSSSYVRTMGHGKAIPPTPEYNHWQVKVTDPTKEGGIVAIYYMGSLIGAIIGGHIGDRIGRVNTIRIGCCFVIVGAALQASAQNVAMMLVARVINGMGTGQLNVIVPVWSAETSDFQVRGLSIALHFTANIFGVVVAYWLDYGLSFIDQGNTQFRWRFTIAFQLVPLLFLATLVNFCPESPRYLVQQKRDDEAVSVLKRLRDGFDDPESLALAEYQDIKSNVEEDCKIDTSFVAMLFKAQGKLHISRRVQLALWFQIIQEWVGIASITVYQPKIFALAGFDSNKAGWLSGLNNIFYTLSTLVAVLTIDRYGRRFNSYWGAIAMGIAMFLVGAFSKLSSDRGSQAFGAASASFVFIYTFLFGATWLAIPWVYQNEIWPVQVRCKGAAWGVIGWSIGNGWLMLLNPIMFDNIAEKTFYIFGAVNFGALAMVYLFYPETSKRTLEEIDWLFSADTPWNWAAERAYAEQAASHVNLARAVHEGKDLEKKAEMVPETSHQEHASERRNTTSEDV